MSRLRNVALSTYFCALHETMGGAIYCNEYWYERLFTATLHCFPFVYDIRRDGMHGFAQANVEVFLDHREPDICFDIRAVEVLNFGFVPAYMTPTSLFHNVRPSVSKLDGSQKRS